MSSRTSGSRVDEIAQCFRACGGDIEAMAAQLQVSKRTLLRRLRELRAVLRRHR